MPPIHNQLWTSVAPSPAGLSRRLTTLKLSRHPLPAGRHASLAACVTLHRIDRGIDTGAVPKYGFPALASNDTEASITAKSMRLAAQMIADALDDAPETDLQGTRQHAAGRCYLAREQRVWRELHYRLARFAKRRVIPTRSERIVSLEANVPQQQEQRAAEFAVAG